MKALIEDLKSDQFAVRQRATVELTRIVEVAEAELRQALAGDLPLESRQRIEQVLQQLNGPETLPERLRTLRAVELLEQMRERREARRLLASLAEGVPAARLTREAQATLTRLKLP